MPKVVQDDLPDNLRPYKFHGLELKKSTKGNYVSDCPFCGKEGKFGILADSGVSKCWSCGGNSEKGGYNTLSFMRELYSLSLDNTTIDDYEELSIEFGLLYKETPKHWGLAKSVVSGRWLAPGFSADGKVMTLYHLTRIKTNSGKYKNTWLPTPNHGQHLCYEHNSKFKQRIYLCEGLKDAMAWWEILISSMEDKDGKLIVANKKSESIIKGSTVIAITGVNVFKEEYLTMFKGKEVILMFDSDHPTKNKKTNKEIPPAGLEGVKRFASRLVTSTGKPDIIKWIDWGGTGIGYDPSLPSGTDVRDFLTKDFTDA